MRVKTIKAANELIGTTWERNGLQRTVTRITNIGESGFGNFIAGNVYWKRPGKQERKQPQWLPYFNNWLSKSKKVN